MGEKVLLESLQGFLALAGNRKYNGLVLEVEVYEDGDISVSFPGFCLVKTEGFQLTQVDFSHCGLDIVRDNTPQRFVTYSQHLRCGQYWHFTGQEHGRLLEQQGEFASLSRPGNPDALDAMLLTANTRNRRCDVAMMLKEIEMAPRHLFEVMGMAERTAGWAWVRSSPRRLYR